MRERRRVDIDKQELPVEEEIRREKARTLGRAGEALSAALAEAWTRFEAWRAGSASPAEYRAARALAEERRRVLLIQREAIGLRSHADVDRCYPFPPADPEAGRP